MMRLNYDLEKADKKLSILTVTLLFFTLNSSNYFYVKWLVTIIALTAIVFPKLKARKEIWIGLILTYIVGNVTHYLEIDNHKFLYIYWSVAILLCLFSEDFEKNISINARLLIGLAFFFAVISKIISSDYLDGSFFMWTSLMDTRVTKFLTWIHLMPRDLIIHNNGVYAQLVDKPILPAQAHLKSLPGLYFLSLIFTYAALIVELIIATLFLLPEKHRLSRWRDYPLLLFIASVYLVVPVWEFGSILSIIGSAQANTKRKSAVYLILFLLMQVYRLLYNRG